MLGFSIVVLLPHGHCWVFQVCWHIECSTLTVSSFRIWNSSAGIPSLPLALFIVMLPKTHLTSHSRMSGYGFVTTSLWLSGSWRSFLYSSSVYSCHLVWITNNPGILEQAYSSVHWLGLCWVGFVPQGFILELGGGVSVSLAEPVSWGWQMSADKHNCTSTFQATCIASGNIPLAK